jgi:hypothetical protein
MLELLKQGTEEYCRALSVNSSHDIGEDPDMGRIIR